jgi:hypothetical protein
MVQKTQFDLVPPEAIKAMADAFADGAKKYGPHQWEPEYYNMVDTSRGSQKKISVMETYAALMRHLHFWISGIKTAEDTGLSHLDHVLARAAMLKTWEAREELDIIDDRPSSLREKRPVEPVCRYWQVDRLDGGH